MGFYLFSKNKKMYVLWSDISKIIFDSKSFDGLFVKILLNNGSSPIIIDFGKGSCWNVNFYNFRKNIIEMSGNNNIILLKSHQWYFKLF